MGGWEGIWEHKIITKTPNLAAEGGFHDMFDSPPPGGLSNVHAFYIPTALLAAPRLKDGFDSVSGEADIALSRSTTH